MRPARRAALIAVLAALCLAGLRDWAARRHSFDVTIYAGAVHSWVAGGDLYHYAYGGRHLGFTYPPFAALFMLPVATLPLNAVIALGAVVNAAAITLTTRAVVGATEFGRRWGVWWTTAAAVPLVCLLQPVHDTFSFGQVNIVLAGLVLLDAWAMRRGLGWAGAGAGIATAVKLTPGLFIVFWLVAQQRRVAAVAACTAAAATLLTAVVAPRTSSQFWTDALLDPSRVGNFDEASNQSLAGMLTRLSGGQDIPTALWLPTVAITLWFGLRRARSAWQHGDPLVALTLTGLTACLVSPISWVHHLWWVVPAIAVLIDVAVVHRSRWHAVTAAALAVLFTSTLPDLVRIDSGSHLAHGPLVVLAENSYALAFLLLLVWLPVRTKVTSRSPDQVPVSVA